MTVVFRKTFDELELRDLIDAGFEEVKLYYANSPDQEFTDSSATVSHTLEELLDTDATPYTMTFTYTGGNYSQWFKFIPEGVGVTWAASLSSPFHGGGGISLLSMRQKLGKETKNMIPETTTSSGSFTTAVCTSPKIKIYKDDYFGGTPNTRGWYFYRLDTQEWDEISNFVQSTGTFTFKSGFGTSVDSGTQFELWRQWNPDEVRDAINWALVESYPSLNKPIIDYSFITEETKFQMYIPNDILTIAKIEIESEENNTSTDSRERGHPWDLVPYEELTDSLQRIAEFKVELPAERRVRVVGTGLLSRMFSDSDFTEIREPQVDMVIYLAVSYLFFILANNAPHTDVNRWREQYTFYKGLYDNRVKSIPVKRVAKKTFGHDSIWKGFE